MSATAEPTAPDRRTTLPSVSRVLEHARIRALLAHHPRPLVVDAIRSTLDRYRVEDIQRADTDVSDVAAGAIAFLEDGERDRLRPVINGTGIILHTGLGRAVLPRRAAQALGQADRCCNLQIDLETGLRGKRNYSSEQLLCRLTGAEAALVVNNNAAATMLILSALCAGREVIVSRGQLIEIGGSFRLPDCIGQSGATLVEVGTTNKTHLRDYSAAMTDATAAILRVNPSNYRIVGFTKSVPVKELVRLKERQPVLVLDDLGCGALINLEEYGLPHEPTVQESIAAGADLACFSGDKLIGGPQSGIVVGRKELIDRIKRHPLTRMLRIDKLTDLALEQTLRLFLDPERLKQEHPTLRMLALPAESVKKRAATLQKALKKGKTGVECVVEKVDSAVGGGTLPQAAIPSYALALRVPAMAPQALARALRRNEPPIISRVHDERVLIDLRTVLAGEERELARALERIATQAGDLGIIDQ
jgi:L-seryl-tRNA(Ser) seleniumtransferase